MQVLRFAAFVLALAFCLFSTSALAALTDAQKSATKAFLISLNKVGTGWDSNSDDFCSWNGITCDDAGMVSIVRNRGLAGFLPTFSGDGENVMVKSIDLSGNNGLNGPFPVEWSNLVSLQSLNLKNTHLYGAIPDSWNSLVNLQSVSLAYTGACYGMPNWDATMAKLEDVDFSHAYLDGRVSSSFSTITTLKSVNLAGNDFCGCVPNSWNVSSVLTEAVSGMAVADWQCSIKNGCDTNPTCKSPSAGASHIAGRLAMAVIALFLFAALL